MPTVTNAGNASTQQWTLTVTASAATISFSNASEDEPALVLTGVTIGHAIVVDGSTRTVTDNGVAAPARIAAGSGWPALIPGDNDITVTGATGTLTFHPLYV